MPTEPLEITITVKEVNGGYEIDHKGSGNHAIAMTDRQAGRRGGEMIHKILAASHAATPVAVK